MRLWWHPPGHAVAWVATRRELGGKDGEPVVCSLQSRRLGCFPKSRDRAEANRRYSEGPEAVDPLKLQADVIEVIRVVVDGVPC